MGNRMGNIHPSTRDRSPGSARSPIKDMTADRTLDSRQNKATTSRLLNLSKIPGGRAVGSTRCR